MNCEPVLPLSRKFPHVKGIWGFFSTYQGMILTIQYFFLSWPAATIMLISGKFNFKGISRNLGKFADSFEELSL